MFTASKTIRIIKGKVEERRVSLVSGFRGAGEIRRLCYSQTGSRRMARSLPLSAAWNSFVLFHACLDEFPLLSAPVAFNYTLIHNPN